MKATILPMVLTAALAAGCAAPHRQNPPPKARPAASAPIVTPDFSLAAKVVSVNAAGRFVIMSFPAGGMPKVGQTLFLYRNGLKTAAVRVTGPQMENNIVADITSGAAEPGDTVRDQ